MLRRHLAVPCSLLSPALLVCLAVGCSSAGSDLQAGGTNLTGPASASDSAGEGQTPDDSGSPPEDDGAEASGESGESSGGDAPVCDAETPVVLYLSPDDSNSTSSPVQAREAVLAGRGLEYTPLRTWEFLNYYSFDYPRAEPGAVVVTPHMARVGASEDTFTLQIGVSSEKIDNADRPLMNITLVLDESGSMAGTAMEMQKAACRAIAGSLRKGDVVSMVGWDVENAVKLSAHVITGVDDPVLLAEVEALEPGGGTDLNGGLVAGYELAQQQFDAARINRVVLISDGGANAGVTDIDIIGAGAGAQDKDGIYLVGVGVGEADSYNDALMDAVTDAGRGASLFIPSVAEADKMFGARFVATMAVAARDVQVELDMPPGFAIVRFSGEEYSSDPAQVEPQHLSPNDAMVFHQTVATCAPERLGEAAELKVTARYRDARGFAEKQQTASLLIGAAVSEPQPMLLKGAAVFEYAEALKAVREGTNKDAALVKAKAAIAEAEAALPGDADLAEIRGVLEML